MPATSEKEKELKKLVKKLEGGIFSSAGKRCEAAKSLGRLGNPDVIPYLIEAIGKEDDETVRKCIIQAIGQIGSPEAVPFLFSMLFEVPAEWKKLVVASLENCIKDENTSFFIDKLSSDSLQKKKLSIMYLGKLGNPEAIPSLIRLLNEPDDDIRKLAFASLKVFNPEDTIPYVTHTIQDADSYYQIRLILLLSEIKSPLAAPILLEMLRSPDVSVRSSAAKALSNCVDNSSISVLEEALEDENPSIRCAAIKELVLLNSEIPLQSLMSFLEDENEHVRSCAVEALGNIGDKSTLPALEKVMFADEDDWVRKLAKNSILQIKEEEVTEPANPEDENKETVDIVAHENEEILLEKEPLFPDEKKNYTFSFCPHCGNRFNFPKTPAFCPFCGQKLLE